MKSIGMAGHIYANDHNGEFPPSFEALLDEQFITRESLQSPLDPQVGCVLRLHCGAETRTATRATCSRTSGSTRTARARMCCTLMATSSTSISTASRQELAATYRRLGREDEMPDDLRP
jgi:hypothetical protein